MSDRFSIEMGKKYDEVWIHRGQPHEFNQRESFLENLSLRDKLIADIGAGTLRFSLEAIKKGCKEIVGLDLYHGLLKWGTMKAKKLGAQNKVSVIVADCRYLPFCSNVFDIVALMGVFEHIPHDQIRLLNEVYRILKPSGVAAIDTWNEIPRALGGLLGFTTEKTEYQKGRFHYRYYYPWEFKRLLLFSKFKEIRIIGVNNSYLHPLLEKTLFHLSRVPKTFTSLIYCFDIVIDKLLRKFIPLNCITGLFLLSILTKD